MNTTSTDWARLTNARDELAERLADAQRHTPGGQLTTAETHAITRSVARAHRIKIEELTHR